MLITETEGIFANGGVPQVCIFWQEKEVWEVAGEKIFVVLANCFQSARIPASPGRNVFLKLGLFVVNVPFASIPSF